MTRLGGSVAALLSPTGGMDLPRILGRNVRDQRKRLGKSQEELALDIGMKRGYLSDLERGVRNPTVKAIERIALALSVDPSELLKNNQP
jgi:transcriptional regulator with XRE-family HTH domain